LLVGQGQFVVVQDGTHASEFDLPAFSDVVVLKVRFQQKSVFSDYFAKPLHKSF
jgi:hypothetical protein